MASSANPERTSARQCPRFRQPGRAAMYETLILLGIVCIIGGVIGGGLKAFGVEIPVLDSKKTGGLIVIGAVLVLVGVEIRPTAPPGQPDVTSVITNPVGTVTPQYCPVNVPVSGSLTTTGGQGDLTVQLHVTPENGPSYNTGNVTVQVNGPGTYTFHVTLLYSANSAGDYEWAVVSPITDGSTAQGFAIDCP